MKEHKCIHIPGLFVYDKAGKHLALATLKEDHLGIICIPNSMDFKSGWGKTEREALKHCQERNGVRSS